ncbi:MAG: aerobic carbon-monoxide dehydrogenase large subunit [Armatimonadota bacterium]|nr:aerobic carbon-monoxide dehydrogenase large subunit [Armatimonadota bacterium]MDR7423056.1 aerobic carbon-monoxide dehydrogenase large subunit [Armatimonadota bacterium]MDR7452937.1 aerobic carbon-monoxide dehydrogenase large subunit [Armatimonadota bacterium]MDR7456337.1 aerobic carbon-monoxide dehydrogenase large subunit [Armatimonadota bacterium]MDR7496994.1 aerobic carbon-monoxide dehydrogenase large subunit [Armatimonadota bacterium]
MVPRTPPEVGGMGHSVKRKEDARFIRGKGTYVDDIQLPGMLYLDIVRSPLAHARITKIDTSKALAIPGVLAVITGADLAKYNLHWMPTLMSDTQMVLPVEKVMYQAQEVAAVLATDRYIAADGVDAVEVAYEPLPVVVDPIKALAPDAPVLRTDKTDKKDNHIWHWEWGDRAATDRAFAEADVTVRQDIYLPRIHVASIETCGCVAHFDRVADKLTVWMTTQAPHAIRTVFALVAGHVGLAEHKIRIISPDIGGGFGGKVPVYPGYVIAVAASVLTGKPVKWVEDRMENLQADSFARDYHMTCELAARKDGTLTALRIKTIADHGYADAAANPSKFPAGLFHICTGSYDFQAAHVEVDGVYTNKPPGGIAYRCSFRVTEAVHAIERMTDLMAHHLGMDPAEFRLKNFIRPEQFPYRSALGWEYDSGNYAAALRKAMDRIGYAELRREQAEKRQRGELMGIGISSFTEIVGAGPSKHFDILGLKMFDSAEIRVHPTGKVIARFGTRSQGQGHETTYAQIIAEELGIPVADIQVEEGDTDTAPYGLGTYASRSTPVAGAAGAMAARKIRDKARKIAAYLLEAAEDDLVWEPGRFSVAGAPHRFKTIQDIAFAAYTNHPQGMEAGLEAVSYYDPPNLTYPFGSYICVVDIDKGTGQVKVRRFVAVDDCGNIINPMIVEGQIHGGLTMGLAPALYEEIAYDENGNIQGGSFIDYLLPTAVETPRWETDKTTTPSPHHPLGAKGVGESATVGAPAAIANAVVDALWHLGVRHVDIPITPAKVWKLLREKGVSE